MTKWDREIRDQFYDPAKITWMEFVKKHKYMRTPKGLLDLKAISRLWKKEKGYDPKPKKLPKEYIARLRKGETRPPKRWFYAMLKAIKARSDVRDPAATVRSIWDKLTPSKREEIKKREMRGERFYYDLPLPQDMATVGTGTVRTVKLFKLGEVQVNVSLRNWAKLLKSRLFSKIKRQDGSVALVKRCKSPQSNVNIFVDKSAG